MFPVASAQEKNPPTSPPNWGRLSAEPIEDVRANFSEPDMIYAPMGYWFWDEPLDREKYPPKVREMAGKMLAQRINPGYVFAHVSMPDLLSRTPGLEHLMEPSPSLPKDEWLSDFWFDCFGAVVETAETHGGYATYADEYMWPSGRADGRVIKRHPELADAHLEWETSDVPGGTTLLLPTSLFTVAAQVAQKSDASEFSVPVTADTFDLVNLTGVDLYGKTSLGQTVTVPSGLLTEVSTLVPSWSGKARSGFTFEARLGGPEGSLIAGRRIPPGIENATWISLQIPKPPPVGSVLYVAMIPDRDVLEQQIGWWSKPEDVYAGGSAFADGKPSEGDRHLKLSYLTRPDLMTGKWIWQPAVASSRHTCYLRKTFEIDADAQIVAASVKITADNRYTLFVGGRQIGQDGDWAQTETYDVAADLHSGRNVIAVEGGGEGGLDALLLDLRIDLAGGKTLRVVSDGTWRVSEKAVEGWTALDCDDSNWLPAREIGPASCLPWNLRDARIPYRPATIHSETLRLIGAGEAFRWTAPPGGDWRVYTFQKVVGGDVNWLDERLAAAFVEIAHQPYAKRFGDRMGRTIPGAMCDTEGNYGMGLAWSDSLEPHYRKITGRDIRLWMPLMLDTDIEGRYGRARFDWFEAVSDLYAGYYAGVSDWLEARGMYYISNLWEESLMWQATCVSDFMKVQRAFSMPGTDCLGLKAYQVHDFKETQSVAEFEGRRYQTEFLGAGTWSTFSPITLKEGVNCTTAWGAGHVVPHAVFMTRKQQGNCWTPDWYDENPLWPYLHLWADFVRRASYVNSQGHLAPDVLLLNPMESIWALLGPGTGVWGPDAGNVGLIDGLFDPKAQNINAVYSDAINQLTTDRVEFLIADRHYIRQMQVKDGRLVRGPLEFKTVVLPPMVVLPLDVARKVVDFARAGGRVYALGGLPAGSIDNGMDDPAMRDLMETLRSLPTVRTCEKGLACEIAERSPGLAPQIEFLNGTFPMLQSHRRIDGRDFFWLVNNGDQARQCEVRVAGVTGGASVWDCESGRIRPAGSVEEGSDSRIRLAFQPHEAYWLVFDPKQPVRSVPVMTLPAGDVILQIAGKWNVRMDTTVQPKLEHPVDLPGDLVDGKGTEHDLALWETWPELPEDFSGLVDYTKTVNLPSIEGPVRVDLGTVHHFAEVWVNGRRVGERLWPPFRFVTDAFRPGPNQIRIRVGNLVNNNYGMASPSGLLGPVELIVLRALGTSE